MTKSSREQQTEDERKILAELQKNSNENIDTIAKHCRFSKQKTSKIIKRLENSHIIWGYSAIVDEQKQGLQRFIISIKRSNKTLDKKSMDEIAMNRLEKIILKLGVTIESSYYGHGDYDWMLIFTVENLISAKKFADALFGAYPGIVEKTSLFQILFIQRDHRVPNPDQTKLKDFL